MRALTGALILAGLLFPIGSQPVAKARHTPALTMTLLYSTNWKHGTLGWRRASYQTRWRVKSGILQCSCDVDQADNSFVAPYQTAGLTNYDVQARFRFSGWHAAFVYQDFGVFIRSTQTPWSDTSGVYAGYDSNDTGKGAAIWLHTSRHNVQSPFSMTDFNPGTGWHTLDLHVNGNQLTLSVDGQPVVSTVTKSYVAKGSVGVFAASAVVAVQWFRIYKA